MSKLIVTEWMSLDGVAQSPASPDEDPSGGFRHGGWHLSYFDDLSMKWVLDNVTSAAAYLLGRRTYGVFAAHWPNATPEERPLAEPLNRRPKYVASRTLTKPLAWENATLLQGDVPAAVTALKRETSGDLLVIGSTELVHALLEHGLVDELRLMIDPIVLGAGKRVFRSDGTLHRLRMTHSQITATGAVLATYEVR